MTGIPQDVRSPIQQSRWVEAHNYGSSTIPAHGVVEVVNNNINAAEFRGVLDVQTPTKKGVPNIAVNSLHPIAPGGTGWVTWDFPAYALGTGLTAGDMAGTTAGSYTLTKGYPGVMVLGSGPSGTGTVRCEYFWEPLARGTLGSDLCPGDASGTVASSWVFNNSLGITSADNIYNLSGLNGYNIALQYDGHLEKWVILQVQHRAKQFLTHILKDPSVPCLIDETRLNISAMYCGAEADYGAVSFQVVDVLDTVSCYQTISPGTGQVAECGLTSTRKQICTLDYTNLAGPYNLCSWGSVQVIENLRISSDGLCIEGYLHTVFVPCQDGAAWVRFICGTDCSTTSSGGTSGTGGGGSGTPPSGGRPGMALDVTNRRRGPGGFGPWQRR